MLETTKAETEGDGEGERIKTTDRRRFVRATAAGVAAIGAFGTGTAAATRRYQTRRLRTETPGQSVIENIELVHDRRLFGEDVFYASVRLTDYAVRYDRQRVVVSSAKNWGWNWNGAAMDRSTGDERERRFLSDVDIPALRTPMAMKPFSVKVWTETDPGQGYWLTQERTIVEPAAAGES